MNSMPKTAYKNMAEMIESTIPRKRCFYCIHCTEADMDTNMSSRLDRRFSGRIGYCEVHDAFVSHDDCDRDFLCRFHREYE